MKKTLFRFIATSMIAVSALGSTAFAACNLNVPGCKAEKEFKEGTPVTYEITAGGKKYYWKDTTIHKDMYGNNVYRGHYGDK